MVADAAATLELVALINILRSDPASDPSAVPRDEIWRKIEPRLAGDRPFHAVSDDTASSTDDLP
jgi:hypothetical protein